MILHLANLETGSSGGRIWFELEETCFPEEGWYDLPGVLLEYWLPALQSFADGHTDFCKLGFLDGPYGLWLMRRGDAVWATCMERGSAVLEEIVDFPAFHGSVQRAARTYRRREYFENK